MDFDTKQYQQQRLADLEAQLRYHWSVVGESMFTIQHLQSRIEEIKTAIQAEQRAAAGKADQPPAEPPLKPGKDINVPPETV